MNFSVQQLQIVLAMLLILNLGILFLLGFLILKTSEILNLEHKEGRGERRFHRKAAETIEEAASKELSVIVSATARSLEQEVKKQIETVTTTVLKLSSDLSAFVAQEQQAVARESQVMVANMVARVDKELEEYKENQLLKVDKQITQIVFAAARQVLGRAISLSEHEDLVSKALERAKKDKFFE